MMCTAGDLREFPMSYRRMLEFGLLRSPRLDMTSTSTLTAIADKAMEPDSYRYIFWERFILVYKRFF